MKKLLPISSLVILALMFTSCKKDYTCSCITNTPGSVATTTKIPIENSKQKDADAACTAKSKTYAVGSITATVTCSLD